MTFLFMVAYALVMISAGRCAYRSSPGALREQTGTRGASSSTALLNTARILTKTNCWKISLSNPQGHCQRAANCMYFSFKIRSPGAGPLPPRVGHGSGGPSASCGSGAVSAGAREAWGKGVAGAELGSLGWEEPTFCNPSILLHAGRVTSARMGSLDAARTNLHNREICAHPLLASFLFNATPLCPATWC